MGPKRGSIQRPQLCAEGGLSPPQRLRTSHRLLQPFVHRLQDLVRTVMADGRQPDHAGLQAVSQNDAPEVVPVQSSHSGAPLERHSSMGNPEVLTPYQQQEKAAQEYYAQQDTRPHYFSGPPPGHQSTARQAEVQTADGGERGKSADSNTMSFIRYSLS